MPRPSPVQPLRHIRSEHLVPVMEEDTEDPCAQQGMSFGLGAQFSSSNIHGCSVEVGPFWGSGLVIKIYWCMLLKALLRRHE